MKNRLAIFIGTWRIILFLPILFGALFLHYRLGYNYTNLTFDTDPAFLQGIFYAWANFDGVHYIEIARNGYTDQARFLPLFPLLIRVVSYGLFFVREELLRFYLAGLLLSNTCTVALVWFLSKLISLDFKKSIVHKTLLFLLLFPTSFFLGAVYAESLFLLLAVGSFICARKQWWLLSCLLAALACTTRIVGIALIPALAFEMYQHYKLKFTWKHIASLAAIPSLLIAYMLFNVYKWHDALYFITAHTELANGRSANIILIPQTLVRYVKIFITVPFTQYEWWIASLEFSMFFYAVWGLWFAWKKHVPMSYIIFSIGAFLIPTFSGTFTGLPRYVLVLFPLFIALAHIESRAVKIIIITAHVLLLFILTILFSRGYYVG